MKLEFNSKIKSLALENPVTKIIADDVHVKSVDLYINGNKWTTLKEKASQHSSLDIPATIENTYGVIIQNPLITEEYILKQSLELYEEYIDAEVANYISPDAPSLLQEPDNTPEHIRKQTKKLLG